MTGNEPPPLHVLLPSHAAPVDVKSKGAGGGHPPICILSVVGTPETRAAVKVTVRPELSLVVPVQRVPPLLVRARVRIPLELLKVGA